MSEYTPREIQAVQDRFDIYAEAGKQLRGGDGGKSKWGRIVLGSDGGPEVHFAKGAGGKLWHLLKVTVLRPYVYYQNYKVLKELESSIRGCVSEDKREAANQNLRDFSQAVRGQEGASGSRKPYMGSYRSFADYVARLSEQGSRTFQEMNVENLSRNRASETETPTHLSPDSVFLSPATADKSKLDKRSISATSLGQGSAIMRIPSILDGMAKLIERRSPGSQEDLLESKVRFTLGITSSPETTPENEKVTNGRGESEGSTGVATSSVLSDVLSRSGTAQSRRTASKSRPGSALEGRGSELRSSLSMRSSSIRSPFKRVSSARESKAVSVVEVPGETGFTSPVKRYISRTPEPQYRISGDFYGSSTLPRRAQYVPATPGFPPRRKSTSTLRVEDGLGVPPMRTFSQRNEPAEILDTVALWKSRDFYGLAETSFAASEGRLRVKLSNYAQRAGAHRTLNGLSKRLSLGVDVIAERSGEAFGSDKLAFERYWGFIVFLQPRNKNTVPKESKNVSGSRLVNITAEGAEHACRPDSFFWAAWEAMLECEIARYPAAAAESLDPAASGRVADSGPKIKKLSIRKDSILKKEELRDSLKPAYEQYLQESNREEVFSNTLTYNTEI